MQFDRILRVGLKRQYGVNVGVGEEGALLAPDGANSNIANHKNLILESLHKILEEKYKLARKTDRETLVDFLNNPVNQPLLQAYLKARAEVAGLVDLNVDKATGTFLENTYCCECAPFFDWEIGGETVCAPSSKCTPINKGTSLIAKPCHFLCIAIAFGVLSLVLAWIFFVAYATGPGGSEYAAREFASFVGFPDGNGTAFDVLERVRDAMRADDKVLNVTCRNSLDGDGTIPYTGDGQPDAIFRNIYAGLMLGIICTRRHARIYNSPN